MDSLGPEFLHPVSQGTGLIGVPAEILGASRCIVSAHFRQKRGKSVHVPCAPKYPRVLRGARSP